MMMNSYAEKITDMKADAIYKFLKNLPEKTNMDKLAESVHYLTMTIVLISRLSLFSLLRLTSIS